MQPYSFTAGDQLFKSQEVDVLQSEVDRLLFRTRGKTQEREKTKRTDSAREWS